MVEPLRNPPSKTDLGQGKNSFDDEKIRRPGPNQTLRKRRRRRLPWTWMALGPAGGSDE
jgi:hypothetical protein